MCWQPPHPGWPQLHLHCIVPLAYCLQYMSHGKLASARASNLLVLWQQTANDSNRECKLHAGLRFGEWHSALCPHIVMHSAEHHAQ